MITRHAPEKGPRDQKRKLVQAPVALPKNGYLQSGCGDSPSTTVKVRTSVLSTGEVTALASESASQYISGIM